MKFCLVLIIFMIAPIVALAQVDEPLADPTQEARAVALGNEIRCVVCQSQSINDSQANMARDMRKVVRAKIVAGWSDGQIITYIRGRYGDFVLLRPPVQRNTYTLWLAPPFFLILAGTGVALVLRNRRLKGGRS